MVGMIIKQDSDLKGDAFLDFALNVIEDAMRNGYLGY